MGRGVMRERLWLVVGFLLLLIAGGFVSMAGRGNLSHLNTPNMSGMVRELPGKLFGDLRDMTVSLAESLNGTPKK
jgi:hypothetical protein